jgi:uncharacterized protein
VKGWYFGGIIDFSQNLIWLIMGLVRLLLFVLLAWLVWQLLRPLLGKRDDSPSPRPPGEVENMVRCAWCGLNLPAGEALREEPHYFCSEEHRRRYLEEGPPDKS